MYLHNIENIIVEVLHREGVAARNAKQKIVSVPHQLMALNLVLFLTLKEGDEKQMWLVLDKQS